MDRAALELMDRWDAESRDRRKSLWLWFCYPNRVDAKTFPPFMAHKLVRDMADYHRRGIRGLFAEPASLPPVLDEAGRRVRETATRAPNVNLLELYVTYKLAYDAALDGDALIDEFFRLYYGAAGPAMQALYEAIEAVYTDPANYAFNPTGYFGFQTPEIAWGRLGTAERIAEFGGRMAAARAAAQTDLERRRVALFEQNIWERMVAGRQAYEEQEARRVPVALTGLSPADCMKPVEPGSEGRPEVPTPLKSAVAARIKGDSPGGDPGRVDWTQAPPGACLLNWGTLDGQPTDRRLEGRLLHDGRFLYLQLQEAMDTSRLVVHGDNNIWAEDDWEIFVARERGSGYRQIGVNANGAYQALTYGETDRKWNLSPAVVSLGNSRCWAVRMALPLERLLPGGVEPGQTVYLNFCRGTGAGLEAVSWNPTFGGFQEPSQLGAIELAP